MARRLLILLFLAFTSGTVFSETRGGQSCVTALLDPYNRLVRASLRDNYLNSLDLERIAQSTVPLNPLLGQVLNVGRLQLLQGFGKELKAMSPERWTGIRKHAQDLLNMQAGEERAERESRLATREVLSPRLLFSETFMYRGVSGIRWTDSDLWVYTNEAGRYESGRHLMIKIGHHVYDYKSAGEIVYLASSHENKITFYTKNGGESLTERLEMGGEVISVKDASNGKDAFVVALVRPGKLVVMRIEDGKLVTDRTFDNDSSRSRPFVTSSGELYISLRDRFLYRDTNGKYKWVDFNSMSHSESHLYREMPDGEIRYYSSIYNKTPDYQMSYLSLRNGEASLVRLPISLKTSDFDLKVFRHAGQDFLALAPEDGEVLLLDDQWNVLSRLQGKHQRNSLTFRQNSEGKLLLGHLARTGPSFSGQSHFHAYDLWNEVDQGR